MSAGTVKKLVNDPADAALEFVAAFAAAHPDLVAQVGERVVARAVRPGPKVGVVTGGGSGHEPAFLGYVGPGLADAVAVGNVFAAPIAGRGPRVDPGRRLRAGRAAGVRQLLR